VPWAGCWKGGRGGLGQAAQLLIMVTKIFSPCRWLLLLHAPLSSTPFPPFFASKCLSGKPKNPLLCQPKKSPPPLCNAINFDQHRLKRWKRGKLRQLEENCSGGKWKWQKQSKKSKKTKGNWGKNKKKLRKKIRGEETLRMQGTRQKLNVFITSEKVVQKSDCRRLRASKGLRKTRGG